MYCADSVEVEAPGTTLCKPSGTTLCLFRYRPVEAPGITLCLFQTDWWKRLVLRCVSSRPTGGSAWHYVVSIPDRLVEAPGTTLCKRLVLRNVRSSTDLWKRLAVRCVSAWNYVV